jgi:PPOX class probable F420-dependent enzyme
MTNQELELFLREPNLARLATIDPDGTPHLVPIWYLRDGDDLVLISNPATRKVRNIRRDPRITVCVDRAMPPYAGVLVRGIADLKIVPRQDFAVQMAVRYLGRDAGVLIGEQYATSDLATIRIPIGRPLTWDYSKIE